MRVAKKLLLLLILAGYIPLDNAVLADDALSTRIYVKTVPSGAEVSVDGKVIGRSDSLFEVAAGHHRIRISLGGQQSIERDADVIAGQITRVEMVLVPAADNKEAAKPVASPQGSDAAVSFLKEPDLAEALRQAMLDAVRQHPDQLRWSGRSGGTLFGIAAKRLPADPKHAAIPALVDLTQMLAINELLTTKSVLDVYQEADLTDATTLAQAVARAAEHLQVSGTSVGARMQGGSNEGYAIAFVLAADSSLRVHLSKAPQLEAVRIAYREIKHAQARELMARHDWKNAILALRHLSQRRLVTPSLYLDAATCFKELDQPDDAIKMLGDALARYRNDASEEFLEAVGNLAIEIDRSAAQDLAVNAYELASSRLKETVVGAEKTVGNSASTQPLLSTSQP